MNPRARTPEELDALLEDAFVLHDSRALASLFEARALLVAGDGAGELRSSEEIALLAPVLWSGDFTYLADPRRVVQAHDIALVLATHGTSVVRRGPDGAWRYAISLLVIDQQTSDQEGGEPCT
ncbi:MAG TPA: hypothetical protein VGR11_01445 [Solirubrobacteraceae bacterium]|nr:hypothetical protein [Solirubrobacteraceae bacterium]